MTWFDALLAGLGVKKIALLAGFIGGVISLRFFEGLTPLGKAFTAFSGAAAANFLTPVALAWFKLDPPASYEGGVGFVLGLFSMSLSAAVIKAIRETDWTAIINRRSGP